jgi:hypothetical protein
MDSLQILNVDQYTVVQLKKLFNESGLNVNFFNEFTMQDVEDGKKRLFFKLNQKYHGSKTQIQSFLDQASVKLIEEKFGHHNLTTNGNILGIRNTTKETNGLINPNRVKRSERIINIDSTYRDFITPFDSQHTRSTSLSLNLSDKLERVVSLQLTNINIPFSFYNIDSKNGTNYFYLETTDSDPSDMTKIEIESGNYDNDTLVDAINTAIQDTSFTDIVVSISSATQKVTIANNGSSSVNVIFYDYLDNPTNFAEKPTSTSAFSNVNNYSKVNYNLGWILGFRDVDQTNIELSYTIDTTTTSVTSEALCFVPYTKYFIITLDDMNKNQTNKGLVEIDNEKMFIDKPRYFNEMDNSLNCISCDNFETYVNSSGRTLTKSQLYSALSINTYRQNYAQKNNKIDTSCLSNVIAIIPFESKSLVWGKSIFMSDKNRFTRQYFGPVDISKMKIEVYDDKGNLLNLNGQDWSLTLLSQHEYQQ